MLQLSLVVSANGLMQRTSAEHSFVLNHMRACYRIKYHATDWIKKCREHPVIRMAGATLQESQK